MKVLKAPKKSEVVAPKEVFKSLIKEAPKPAPVKAAATAVKKITPAPAKKVGLSFHLALFMVTTIQRMDTTFLPHTLICLHHN